MRHMKHPTVRQPPAPDRSEIGQLRANATETGPKAHGNRHFKQMILPDLVGSGPILPEWLSRLFRRKDGGSATVPSAVQD
jgi:hypothetical protein